MTFMEKLTVAINVLKDWRAIFITILFLLICCLASYVVKYQKKPISAPAKKSAPKASAAPKAEENAGEAGAEGGEGGES